MLFIHQYANANNKYMTDYEKKTEKKNCFHRLIDSSNW